MFESYIPYIDVQNAVEHASPGAWAKIQARWNPTNDPWITELQWLRFTVLRAIKLRDSTAWRFHWRHMDTKQQIIIEAELNEYMWLYENLYRIEMDYIYENLEKNAKAITAYIDSGALLKDITWGKIEPDTSNPDATDMHVATLEITNAMSSQTLLYNDDIYIDFTNTHIDRIKQIREEWKPADYAAMRRWFDKGIRYEQETDSSMVSLFYDLHNHQDQNQLGGKGDRLLLVNHGIPKPKLSTFVAWFQLCGVNFERLTLDEQLYFRVGFEPTHRFVFVLPHLPMTKEHKQGGSYGTDDSDASHSLPFKSAGHRRTPEGLLDHGIWESYYALVGPEGSKIISMGIQPTMKNRGRALLAYYDEIVPRKRVSYFDPEIFYDRELVSSGLYDPDSNDLRALSLAYQYDRPIDTGMRSFARFKKIHFRFDLDPVGLAASNAWTEQFLNIAQAYLNSNFQDRFKLYYRDAFDGERNRSTDVLYKTGKKGNVFRIDFGNLFD